MKVLSNTAVSLDGRIATRAFDHVVLGTRTDRDYMSVLRARADAVLVGGRTFRNWPLPLVPDAAAIVRLGETPLAAEPPEPGRIWINAIVTRGGELPPAPRFWADTRVRPIVFSGAPVEMPRGENVVGSADVGSILAALAARGVETLLLECGGDLLFQFLAADAVDELFITYCPVVVGGLGAPSLVDGAGFAPDTLRRFRLGDLHRVGDELYLRYVR